MRAWKSAPRMVSTVPSATATDQVASMRARVRGVDRPRLPLDEGEPAQAQARARHSSEVSARVGVARGKVSPSRSSTLLIASSPSSMWPERRN